jgi:hypothetical protein
MPLSLEQSSHQATQLFGLYNTFTTRFLNTTLFFNIKHSLLSKTIPSLIIKMRSATLLALLPFALAAPSRRAEPAPVLRPRGVKLVDGKYIVKMKGGIRAASVSATVSTIEADADYTYSKSFSGFAASLKDDEIEKLKNDPNVSDILYRTAKINC